MSNEITEDKAGKTPENEMESGGKSMAESEIEVQSASGAQEDSQARPELSPADMEQLKTKAAKADEYYDRLLRQAAEFENFKKRAAREKQDAIKYANTALLEKLISVMDHFEMALAATTGSQPEAADSFRKGIEMILNQFRTVVGESGLEEINALHQLFDPNFHEAVSVQESTEVAEDHVVVQLRKGYKLKDRLLRPATVVIAKKPPTT
jgi:molecular chaperone GrpE